MTSTPNAPRIASLLPSATDILIKLNLAKNIIGITHECDGYEQYFKTTSSNPEQFYCVNNCSNTTIATSNTTTTTSTEESDDTRGEAYILTSSHINPSNTSQSDINEQVKNSSLNGMSIYDVNVTDFQRCKPTLIITQTLCDVCAVSMNEVKESCNLTDNDDDIKLLSLTPKKIIDVGNTFKEIANVCNVGERGDKMYNDFFKDFDMLNETIKRCLKENYNDSSVIVQQPKVLMIEWMDPPYTAGHWVPEMINYANCVDAITFLPNYDPSSTKSNRVSWDELHALDPDVIIIACCGFDTVRNEQDAINAKKYLSKFDRAYNNNRIYATDGNKYFTRPGPYLLSGAAIIARCAYDNMPSIAQCIEDLGNDMMPKDNKDHIVWKKVIFD